jgi:hypothetical protein
MTNVILPEEFVATQYPGYFWNVKIQKLFTAKLGVLRELKYSGPNQWNHYTAGYRISDKGVRKTLTLKYLQTLQVKASVFPVLFTTVKSSTNDDVAINLGKLPAGTKVRVYIES